MIFPIFYYVIHSSVVDLDHYYVTQHFSVRSMAWETTSKAIFRSKLLVDLHNTSVGKMYSIQQATLFLVFQYMLYNTLQ
jgi:hypothetical protein